MWVGECYLQGYFKLTSLFWKVVMDLEGITGFELGHVLDAVSVLIDKEEKWLSASLAERKQDRISSSLQWIQAITWFICQLKSLAPPYDAKHTSLYTSFDRSIWLPKESGLISTLSVCKCVHRGVPPEGLTHLSEHRGSICDIKETC